MKLLITEISLSSFNTISIIITIVLTSILGAYFIANEQ